MNTDVFFRGWAGSDTTHFDIHPTKPWIVALDKLFTLSVFDYKLGSVLFSISLHSINNSCSQYVSFFSLVSKQAPNWVKFPKNPSTVPATFKKPQMPFEDGQEASRVTRISSPISVNWYDNDVRFWQIRRQLESQMDISVLQKVERQRFKGSLGITELVQPKSFSPNFDPSWIVVITSRHAILVDYKTQALAIFQDPGIPQSINSGKTKSLKIETISSFSFIGSSNWFLLGQSDGNLRIWDPVRNILVAKLLKGHSRAITAVEPIYIAGQYANCITGASDGSMTLWNLDQKVKVLNWPDVAHKRYTITHLQFLPWMNSVLSITKDGAATYWCLESQDPLTESQVQRGARIFYAFEKKHYPCPSLIRHPFYHPGTLLFRHTNLPILSIIQPIIQSDNPVSHTPIETIIDIRQPHLWLTPLDSRKLKVVYTFDPSHKHAIDFSYDVDNSTPKISNFGINQLLTKELNHRRQIQTELVNTKAFSSQDIDTIQILDARCHPLKPFEIFLTTTLGVIGIVYNQFPAFPPHQIQIAKNRKDESQSLESVAELLKEPPQLLYSVAIENNLPKIGTLVLRPPTNILSRALEGVARFDETYVSQQTLVVEKLSFGIVSQDALTSASSSYQSGTRALLSYGDEYPSSITRLPSLKLGRATFTKPLPVRVPSNPLSNCQISLSPSGSFLLLFWPRSFFYTILVTIIGVETMKEARSSLDNFSDSNNSTNNSANDSTNRSPNDPKNLLKKSQTNLPNTPPNQPREIFNCRPWNCIESGTALSIAWATPITQWESNVQDKYAVLRATEPGFNPHNKPRILNKTIPTSIGRSAAKTSTTTNPKPTKNVQPTAAKHISCVDICAITTQAKKRVLFQDIVSTFEDFANSTVSLSSGFFLGVTTPESTLLFSWKTGQPIHTHRLPAFYRIIWPDSMTTPYFCGISKTQLVFYSVKHRLVQIGIVDAIVQSVMWYFSCFFFATLDEIAVFFPCDTMQTKESCHILANRNQPPGMLENLVRDPNLDSIAPPIDQPQTGSSVVYLMPSQPFQLMTVIGEELIASSATKTYSFKLYDPVLKCKMLFQDNLITTAISWVPSIPPRSFPSLSSFLQMRGHVDLSLSLFKKMESRAKFDIAAQNQRYFAALTILDDVYKEYGFTPETPFEIGDPAQLEDILEKHVVLAQNYFLIGSTAHSRHELEVAILAFDRASRLYPPFLWSFLIVLIKRIFILKRQVLDSRNQQKGSHISQQVSNDLLVLPLAHLSNRAIWLSDHKPEYALYAHVLTSLVQHLLGETSEMLETIPTLERIFQISDNYSALYLNSQLGIQIAKDLETMSVSSVKDSETLRTPGSSSIDERMELWDETMKRHYPFLFPHCTFSQPSNVYASHQRTDYDAKWLQHYQNTASQILPSTQDSFSTNDAFFNEPLLEQPSKSVFVNTEPSPYFEHKPLPPKSDGVFRHSVDAYGILSSKPHPEPRSTSAQPTFSATERSSGDLFSQLFVDDKNGKVDNEMSTTGGALGAATGPATGAANMQTIGAANITTGASTATTPASPFGDFSGTVPKSTHSTSKSLFENVSTQDPKTDRTSVSNDFLDFLGPIVSEKIENESISAPSPHRAIPVKEPVNLFSSDHSSSSFPGSSSAAPPRPFQSPLGDFGSVTVPPIASQKTPQSPFVGSGDPFSFLDAAPSSAVVPTQATQATQDPQVSQVDMLDFGFDQPSTLENKEKSSIDFGSSSQLAGPSTQTQTSSSLPKTNEKINEPFSTNFASNDDPFAQFQ